MLKQTGDISALKNFDDFSVRINRDEFSSLRQMALEICSTTSPEIFEARWCLLQGYLLNCSYSVPFSEFAEAFERIKDEEDDRLSLLISSANGTGEVWDRGEVLRTYLLCSSFAEIPHGKVLSEMISKAELPDSEVRDLLQMTVLRNPDFLVNPQFMSGYLAGLNEDTRDLSSDLIVQGYLLSQTPETRAAFISLIPEIDNPQKKLFMAQLSLLENYGNISSRKDRSALAEIVAATGAAKFPSLILDEATQLAFLRGQTNRCPQEITHLREAIGEFVGRRFSDCVYFSLATSKECRKLDTVGEALFRHGKITDELIQDAYLFYLSGIPAITPHTNGDFSALYDRLTTKSFSYSFLHNWIVSQNKGRAEATQLERVCFGK